MFLLVTVCYLFVFVFNLFRYISQNSLKLICLLNSLGWKVISRMLASWVRSSLYFRSTDNIPSVYKNRYLCLPSKLLIFWYGRFLNCQYCTKRKTTIQRSTSVRKSEFFKFKSVMVKAGPRLLDSSVYECRSRFVFVMLWAWWRNNYYSWIDNSRESRHTNDVAGLSSTNKIRRPQE